MTLSQQWEIIAQLQSTREHLHRVAMQHMEWCAALYRSDGPFPQHTPEQELFRKVNNLCLDTNVEIGELMYQFENLPTKTSI